MSWTFYTSLIWVAKRITYDAEVANRRNLIGRSSGKGLAAGKFSALDQSAGAGTDPRLRFKSNRSSRLFDMLELSSALGTHDLEHRVPSPGFASMAVASTMPNARAD